jgi:glutamine amidotransferase
MIAIVQYNAGNIQSVLFALERLGIQAVVTDDPETLLSADKVIFPGVGEAGSAMQYLRAKGLDQVLPAIRQPFLGICLGMQLMCTHSEESNTACLGIFPNTVQKFIADPIHKVPQMGWNTITRLQEPLFRNIPEASYVYMVHSYYAGISTQTAAVCSYIQPYSAALQRDNFYGVQFHPEKSAATGEQVLQNFLSL